MVRNRGRGGQRKKTLERFRGLSSTFPAGVNLGGLELWLGAWGRGHDYGDEEEDEIGTVDEGVEDHYNYDHGGWESWLIIIDYDPLYPSLM